MPSRESQVFFREFGKRGPMSCILVERGPGNSDPEMLTIFWAEVGLDPATPEEALIMFRANRDDLLAAGDDDTNPSVVNGVLNDKARHAPWQKRVLDRKKAKAGWS